MREGEKGAAVSSYRFSGVVHGVGFTFTLNRGGSHWKVSMIPIMF